MKRKLRKTKIILVAEIVWGEFNVPCIYLEIDGVPDVS